MSESKIDPFLYTLDFPISNELRRNGVQNLRELLALTSEELVEFEGLSSDHIKKVKHSLRQYDLQPGEYEDIRRSPLSPEGIGAMIENLRHETQWTDWQLGLRCFHQATASVDGSFQDDTGRYLVTVQLKSDTYRVQVDADEQSYDCSCLPDVTNKTPPCPHTIAALLTIALRFRLATMRQASPDDFSELETEEDQQKTTPIYQLVEHAPGTYRLLVLRTDHPMAYQDYSPSDSLPLEAETLTNCPVDDRMLISRLIAHQDEGNQLHRFPDDLIKPLHDRDAYFQPLGGEPQPLELGEPCSVQARLVCQEGQLFLRAFLIDGTEEHEAPAHRLIGTDPAWFHSGGSTLRPIEAQPHVIKLYRKLRRLNQEGRFLANNKMDLLNDTLLPALRQSGIEVELGEGVLDGVDPVGELYLKEKAGDLTIDLGFRSPKADRIAGDRTYAVQQNNGSVLLCEDNFKKLDLKVEGKKKLRKRLRKSLKDVAEEGEGIQGAGKDTFRVPAPEAWLGSKLPELVQEGFDVYGREDLDMFETPSELKETEVEVSSDQDWFAMSGEFEFENAHGETSSAALSALLEAIENGQDYVQLADGSEGKIPEKWKDKLEKLANSGADIDERSNDQVNVPKAAGDTARDFLDQADTGKADQESEQFMRHWSELPPADESDPLPTPAGFNGELRDYQKVGLGWLQRLTQAGIGGILADDMGLGKTIQMLALFQHDRNQRGEWGRMLVVAPKAVLENWQNEANEFTPEAPTKLHHGGRRDSVEELPDRGLIVTTYGTMRSDAEALKKEQFDFLVLDEAHRIRNFDTKNSEVARSLKGEQRFGLTGTPVQNNITDIWAQFEFLIPGLLGSQEQFKRQFKGTIEDEEDQEVYDRLKALLAPLILHRRKEAVEKDLPGLTVKKIECQLRPEEREVYEGLREQFRLDIEQAEQSENMDMLKKLMRLRQLCCSPKLIEHDPTIDQLGGSDSYRSSKVRYFEEAAKRVIEKGNRILVFSQYTQFLDILEGVVREHDWGYQRYDGSTSNQEAVVNRFNEGDDPLFLISLKAGGEGLNLTAANHVFIMDPWWNPAAEEQAQDRAHRIGQEDHVYSYQFFCPDTVEERVMALQDEKARVADRLLAPDKNLLKQLDGNEIEGLLR